MLVLMFRGSVQTDCCHSACHQAAFPSRQFLFATKHNATEEHSLFPAHSTTDQRHVTQPGHSVVEQYRSVISSSIITSSMSRGSSGSSWPMSALIDGIGSLHTAISPERSTMFVRASLRPIAKHSIVSYNKQQWVLLVGATKLAADTCSPRTSRKYG